MDVEREAAGSSSEAELTEDVAVYHHRDDWERVVLGAVEGHTQEVVLDVVVISPWPNPD